MKATMTTITLNSTEKELLLALLDEAVPNLFSETIKEKLNSVVIATISARTSDPDTSKAGAISVAFRAGTQKMLLLQAYANLTAGLTDEEAGTNSGLAQKPKCCYCSELRQAGFIKTIGATRPSSVGEAQQVCAITEAGLAMLGA
jgi:hypothetical protein